CPTATASTLDSRLHLRRLPAAPEGFVERDQADDERSLTLHPLVLRRVERSLIVEHGQKIGETADVELTGQCERNLVRIDGLRQPLLTCVLLAVRNERVFCFLQGAQHRLVVARQRGLLARFLNADVRPDASAGEDRPDHLRADRGEAARAREYLAGVGGGDAERAGQRETREELRRRHADPSSRRG